MTRKEIRHLSQKLYFTAQDVAQLLKIKPESAQVLCSRYVSAGHFVRLKKNFYVLDEKWDQYHRSDFYKLANHLQVPSYISCATALTFHGISTQVQQNWFDSVCGRRSVDYHIRGVVFRFLKIKAEYYFDFEKTSEMFMARPEKAFADACHLSVFSDYSLDVDACDLNRLNKDALKKVVSAFPARTQRLVMELCGI